ncbi:MAG: hypothetical protein KIB51_06740 [Dysgonomonas mossii]|nr:hypothetical protein [Dysgonomonas mossii]
MYFKPHKLYIHKPGTSYKDDEGNWHTSNPSTEYLSDCFLHDISIKEQIGLAGVGIKATKKINLDRNDALKLGDKVEIKEGELQRGIGDIQDIKHTSNMGNNYTQILI